MNRGGWTLIAGTCRSPPSARETPLEKLSLEHMLKAQAHSMDKWLWFPQQLMGKKNAVWFTDSSEYHAGPSPKVEGFSNTALQEECTLQKHQHKELLLKGKTKNNAFCLLDFSFIWKESWLNVHLYWLRLDLCSPDLQLLCFYRSNESLVDFLPISVLGTAWPSR